MDNDNRFTEMKDLPELSGTLNMIVSQQRSMYRPLSLSDSFAFSPENIQRTQFHLREQNAVAEIVVVAAQPHPSSVCEQCIVEILIKLSFHITLISIFETLFFFFFVSFLENTGIQNTVQTFIGDAVSVCSNLTSTEIVIVDNVLEQYINVTAIADQANIEYMNRVAYNNILFNKAWIYVGALGGLFVFLVCYACVRKLTIAWNKVIFENLAMVVLLALYEYMFFTTVIVPYKAVSSDEIAHNAIANMQTTCGILR